MPASKLVAEIDEVLWLRGGGRRGRGAAERRGEEG